MSRQPNRQLASVFALCVGLFFPAPADQVDEYVSAQIKRRQIPGLSLAVVRDGRVMKAAGYGLANVEWQIPATPETVYEIGSISKQFTAEAVMLLVEEGKLGLDDLLSQYLSDLPPAWAKITVRHVLTHTAGLKDWDHGPDFSYRRDYTPGEFIKLVAAYPLDFQPGEQWAYTSSGTPLLGMVVERVSGQPFMDFVTARIFKPLGMTATRFKDPAEVVPHRASGYLLVNGALRNGEPARPRVIAPSGGILSTVLDLAKWDTALHQGRLLKSASLQQMLAPARLNNGQAINHGFAWFKDAFNGHRMIFHHGTTVAGYGAVFRRYVDDHLTIIMLGNLDDGAFGVEAMSKVVANFYVPGLCLSGLKEQPDSDPQMTQRLLKLLRDLAAGQDSDWLTPILRERLPQERKTAMATQLREMKSFAFLGSEKLGQDHFRLDPGLERTLRYKMLAGERAVYYTFTLTSDGKIAQLFFEEG